MFIVSLHLRIEFMQAVSTSIPSKLEILRIMRAAWIEISVPSTFKRLEDMHQDALRAVVAVGFSSCCHWYGHHWHGRLQQLPHCRLHVLNAFASSHDHAFLTAKFWRFGVNSSFQWQSSCWAFFVYIFGFCSFSINLYNNPQHVLGSPSPATTVVSSFYLRNQWRLVEVKP